MLEDMGCVTPGKALGELKVLFLGRECFESLPEAEILEIYDLHQRELIARSKKNFQELLLERSDLFYQYRDEIVFHVLIIILKFEWPINQYSIPHKFQKLHARLNFDRVSKMTRQIRMGFILTDLAPRER